MADRTHGPAYPCPALSPYVEATLDALRSEGVTPTDAEIAWLARLRERCDCPGSEPFDPRWPVHFGGVAFWPRHRLATRWWLTAHRALEHDGHEAQLLAYLYAHAHSAPGDVSLRGVTDLDALPETLRAWGEALAIHDEHLAGLCDRLRELDGVRDDVPSPTPPKDAQAQRDGEGAFLAGMARLFPGTPVEYWQSGISEREALDLANAAGGSDKWATCATRQHAVENYLRAVKWIRMQHANG